MKLIERINCPVCFNLEHKILFKISYKDEKILKFLNEYYENKMPVHLLKDFDYQLVECNECKLIFQKYIPDSEFSNKLYDEIISSDASLKKKLDMTKKLN